MSVLRPSKPHSKDPYQILGLGHDATPAQIKVAYRKLALKYHPDRQSRVGGTSIPIHEQSHQSQNQTPPTRQTHQMHQTLPTPQTPRQQHHKQHAQPTQPNPNAQPAQPTPLTADQLQQQQKEATDKFAELSAAYALLTDPVKKREYDHLYKFGAFDEVETERRGSTSHAHTAHSSYTAYTAYTAYTSHTAHTSQPSRPGFAARAPPPMQFARSESCDSFFEEMIYTPQHLKQPNNNNTNTSTNCNNCNNRSADSSNQNQNQCHFHSTSNNANNPNVNFHPNPKNHFNPKNPKRAGIGFAFPPLGKHLSIHIPSRHDLILAMARGKRLHNFGTRVTFSTQERTGGCGGFHRNLEHIGRIMSCPTMLQDQKDRHARMDHPHHSHHPQRPQRPPQKFVSTTTRIAHGQHRVVKRTAYVHCDGRKEVVVEENGVVRRRYVLEAEKEKGGKDGTNEAKDSNEAGSSNTPSASANEPAEPPSPANSLKNNSVEENTNGDNNHNDHRPWFFHLWTGMRERVIRPCLAPCNPVIAT